MQCEHYYAAYNYTSIVTYLDTCHCVTFILSQLDKKDSFESVSMNRHSDYIEYVTYAFANNEKYDSFRPDKHSHNIFFFYIDSFIIQIHSSFSFILTKCVVLRV